MADNRPPNKIIYYFRSDGYTVRDTVEGLTAECKKCGELLRFSAHAKPFAIDTDLQKHRRGCETT